MWDVVIIGAGVAGAFITRELSRYPLDILLLEKESDVGNETTMANSGIIHAGYDAKWSSLKGRFNSAGNALYDKVCEELDVPFKRCGSLVLAFKEASLKTLKALYENGQLNHVPGLEILDREGVLAMEKNITENVCYGLYAPTAGIISPWELAIALCENAVDNGVTLKLNAEVKKIKNQNGIYMVETNEEHYEAHWVINCAGVYGDHINQMITRPYFKIIPRKGQYFVLDKDCKDFVKHVVFQCPTAKGKGVLIAPTVHGNILIGPNSESNNLHNDLSTTSEGLKEVRETALLTSDKIPFNKVIRTFSGIRATSDTGDFIIEEVPDSPGFINVAGFDSPGLSSIPAVAQHVVEMIKGLAGGICERQDFNPRRRRVIRFNELSYDEKAKLVKENPAYGRVICRCETITEAEIVDAIHRSVGATTIKGVKKRVRPGTGRCQGGFCIPRVMEILARELNKDLNEITYDGPSSYVVLEETKKGVL